MNFQGYKSSTYIFNELFFHLFLRHDQFTQKSIIFHFTFNVYLENITYNEIGRHDVKID